MSSRFVVAGLSLALLASELGADDRPQPGAVEQRGGPVSQDVKLPPLEEPGPNSRDALRLGGFRSAAAI
jgi:hypothetical protein